MSKSPPITITSAKLRACVEELLGAKIPDGLWRQAEMYARHKLSLYRQRQPDVAYYDDKYLILLTADTVRETAFSLFTAEQKDNEHRRREKERQPAARARKGRHAANRHRLPCALLAIAAAVFVLIVLSAGAASQSDAPAPAFTPTSTPAATASPQPAPSTTPEPTPSPSPDPTPGPEQVETCRFSLTPEERDLTERVVMAEAGGECFEGQMAVAQCILNACEKTGSQPSEVVLIYQYAKPAEMATQSVKDAVTAVFDAGDTVTTEPILFFYAPRRTVSQWHESQRFVIEIGGHRFFAEKGANP